MLEETAGEMEHIEDRASSNIAWFLVGVVVGSAAAILYAPKSGRETREYLAQKAREGREALECTTCGIAERSQDMYQKGRQLVDDAADLFERGRKLARG